MHDMVCTIDPSQWFGRLQRAYLANPDEQVLDELTDIGRLLAVTGTAVESVIEVHGAVLAEELAGMDGRDPVAVIEAATICLSEVMVAWRVAAEVMGEPPEETTRADLQPPVFLRFDREGRFAHARGRDGHAGTAWEDWASDTLDAAMDKLGVAARRDEVREAIVRRRLMILDVHPPAASGRVMRAVICPFRDGSGIMGVHDVSARRAAAEAAFQRRKLESLGQLAGGIAHELNNLLQPILTAAQFVCEDHADDAELMADTRIILDSARAAADVVNDILAFARRGAAHLAPMRLGDAVRHALRSIGPSVPPRVRLEVEIADERASVAANAGELGQVLRNLLGNAFDAVAGDGTITVSVTPLVLDEVQALRQLMPAGRYVRLSVADDGCGVDAATAQRMFEPFFTTKEIGKGTGLGLAIVRGIVQSWGGTILLRHGVAKGAAFDIVLPAMAHAGAETACDPVVPPRRNDGHPVVMVVDDDIPVATAVARPLRRAGYDVCVFHSASDALEHFAALAPQLVVTDLIMPDMDGLTFVAEVRRRHGHTHTILLTGGGLASDEPRTRAEHEGVEHLLYKPVDGERLLAAVESCLNPSCERQAEKTK